MHKLLQTRSLQLIKAWRCKRSSFNTRWF